MSAGILSHAQRLSKLRSMSTREVIQRVRYTARLTRERRDHAAGRLTRPDRLKLALQPRFVTAKWHEELLAARLGHRTRYFASLSAPEVIRSLFATIYRQEHAAAREHAARARRGLFEFFGEEFDLGGGIDWQSDPVSGRRWPSLYHADVPVHGGDVGFGDVKYVWELNRQQFLIDLGKTWWLDRNPDDLQALRHFVRSWISGNPYATGVNWSCALEPAFRVFSWLWAYYFSVEDLDPDFHLEWLEAFYDHGRFIEQHLELYSSPFNHLIAEAAALFMLGTSFPEFRDAERWQRRGREILEQRLAAQFYADGGSVEQSTFYHHATVGFYLLAGILARATRNDLTPAVWEAIERALQFSMTLSQPDGKTPTIGGADDGKPIRMEHLPLWDFRPYHAIGAVLFSRADFKHLAGRFHEDALWLLGPEGLNRFSAIEARRPAETATALPASGYYVMRSEWSDAADYVCFDCGEQAAGMRTDGVPNSMHGHADCLSVIAWLQGYRVLVDSGLFAYNCGGAWEAHFRETAAHNTAKVDGRDQALHIKSMAWTHSYTASPEAWMPAGEHAWVIGSHDGYARGPDGVVHRRAVWLRPDACLLVYDEFVGAGEHALTVNYQFAPGTLELVGGDRALFAGSFDVTWAGSMNWSAALAHGGPGPEDGWIAPSLGIRASAPRLTLSCVSAQNRTSLLTVLAARASESRVRFLTAGDGQGRVALVRGSQFTDLVSAAGIASTPAVVSDALLVVCRFGDDGAVETRSTGGSHVRLDHELLSRLVKAGNNQHASAHDVSARAQ